jgi:uncharacterized membrane protein
LLLALAMTAVGTHHFVDPAPYVGIVPESLSEWALPLVYVSGVFEILGGIGILPTRSRRFAGWGLIALYLAVFPANLNMAINGVPFGDAPASPWALWGRLPFQALFIAWAWWVAASHRARPRPSGTDR